MATVTQFVPSQTGAFVFLADLSGPTSNVTSTSTQFTVSVTWNVFGQRFYVALTDQDGALVLTTPLVSSAPSPAEQFNMLAGYFSSTMVLLEGSQEFVVTT